MYFKQLEMTGFKSFADRTVVRLEPGITAIVGPNGCGKSNILDAIRWVLGEQNARELRGAHMQDVIFNGSETRHATGMAEVSVTFDNSDGHLPVDFSEVQVTRRVYRSGESEYLINKAPCRLKDIHEIFMDTGIGTAAYSMVGQGKMDMILSSKPEERRYLFEEAAGIIKYKSRKKVAMRKLDSAEQNLLRLGDIIAEVERQMRSLKRQVNAAIRYRELSEGLREYEIRSVFLKYSVLVGNIDQLRASFAEAGVTYEKLNTETAQLEARYQELGLAKLEVDRILTARRETVYDIATEMDKIERQVALLRQQIDFSKEQQQQALREHDLFKDRAANLQGRIAETHTRGTGMESEAAECRAALDEKERAHAEASERVAATEQHLEALRAQGVERLNFRAKTQTELETLNVGLDNIESQLRVIYDRQESEGKRHEDLLERHTAIQAQEAEKRAALAELDAQRTAAAEDQANKTKRMREVNEAWQNHRERKSSTEARLHSLRELRDAYEGFAQGVRAVMLAKQNRLAEAPGIIGPAGDLLSTEKNYERAIEAALGGNINNVIVEHAEDAKAAIDFLKKHQAGRVTFLPLDTIRSSGRDEGRNLLGKRGVVGMAIDMVQFEQRIHSAVEYLLHSTVIVETLDDAIRITRENSRFPRLVTLDGEVVSGSGAVTGGRMKNESRGMLGRSAEIAELEDRVAVAEREIAKLATEGQGLQEAIQALTARVRELDTARAALDREWRELGVVVARQTADLENLTSSGDALSKQRDTLCARREELEAKRREALERAGSLEMDDEAVERATAEAQEENARARQALSVCADELTELRVKVAALIQRIEQSTRDHEREQREHEEAVREAQRRLELNTQFEGQQATLAEEVALQLERAKALSETKGEAQEKVVEAENNRNKMLDESEKLEKRLRELRDLTRAAQANVHQLEIKLRHDEDRIVFFQERISTEYHINLATLTAEEVGTDDLDDETREQKVEDFRRQLERMGPVNLGAIEEYDAMEKRHEFLVTQSADLQQAKQVLLDVIARSDKRIKEMFLQTFNDVAENFRRYFRTLFVGGQARVYLLDEDDPLESGIEVEARPPGKKPQSISLLSGGESAMTAVALLFAIFKAKPSPFCVLDEVDAPLDDANIGRFLNLLNEFTEGSQFVVITHSKQTMAKADILYGVTQQERGVSTLVSVKFAQDSAA
ncbi:MAG: chromosome segregation protein SMC [FCB group bacterium]|jgi:chromosome segregation protein|nr:chromosome segregation protein SMC [FCB group bacterium]